MNALYETVRDEERHASIWQCVNDQYPTHFHTSIEVYLVTEGRVVCTQEGREYPMGPGEVFVNSSCMLHGHFTPDASRSIVAVIPLDVAPGLRKKLSNSRFRDVIYRGDRREEIVSLIHIMRDAFVRRDEASADALSAALLTMLVADMGLEDAPREDAPDFVRELIRFVQESLTEELNMKLLAQHFGYSTGRMSHLFNEKIGCSLTRYVNSYRCRYAMGLLSGGAISVLDAAIESGFSNVRTFYRAFEKEYGAPPGAFIEKHRKTET